MLQYIIIPMYNGNFVLTKLSPYFNETIPPYKGHIDSLVVLKLCIVGLHFMLITHHNGSYSMFHNMFHIHLFSIRTLENYTYKIYEPLHVILLKRFCLGLSQLKEHTFRHNFADTLNPLCHLTL